VSERPLDASREPRRMSLGADDAPFLRPQQRWRARPTRRSRGRRITLLLQLVGAAGGGLAVIWAGYARVMASEQLRVTRVEVRGNSWLSEGEVREMLGPAVGENILGMRIDVLKARLTASPWVAAASVRRSLPNTLSVEIHERVPLALAEVDRLYLMDGDGRLIDIYGPRTSGFDLPIVRGLRGLGAEARRDQAARAGALLRDLADLAEQVSEVRVEDSGDLRVVLRGAGEVLRLGEPPCRSRLADFLRLRTELVARCPHAEYFDLRFRSRIIAKEPVTTTSVSKPTNADGAAQPAAPGLGERVARR
jgi:cell division septal protein FtsQ